MLAPACASFDEFRSFEERGARFAELARSAERRWDRVSRFGTSHLLIAATLLVGGGLVMVYSASAVSAELEQGTSYVYLLRQIAAAGRGSGAPVGAGADARGVGSSA